MPDAVNVDLVENDDEDVTFQLTSDGAALDLSSVTVSAVIKTSEAVEDDDEGAHVLTVGDGLTVVDAATGKAMMTFPAAVTAAPSVWFYKIKVAASGDTKTAVWGWITVQDA